MYRKKIIYSQKGSMSIYAMATVLSILMILTGIFIVSSTLRKNQLRTTYKIKEIYAQDVNLSKQSTEAPEENVLPSEYQQVEYIESSGTQWIDTKYIVNINTEIDIEYEFTEKPTDFQAVIFNGQSGTEYSGIGISAYSNEIIYEIGNFTVKEPSNDLTKKKIYISKDIIEVNNNTTNNEGDFTYIKPSIEKGMSIFAATWSNKNYLYYVKAKVYGLKIIEGEKKLRHFIPCYATTTVTDVDGIERPKDTIGMYDTVEGKFYTNQGTGQFFKGADV